MAKGHVCGMQVNEGQAAGTSESQAETDYFHSPGCKEQFGQHPERYTSEGTARR